MRNGFKVYDSDTHVTASAEELEPYLASSVKGTRAGVGEIQDAHQKDLCGSRSGASLLPPL